MDNALSEGPHQLIRDGAVLTSRLEDIIDNLGPLPHAISSPSSIDNQEFVPPELQQATPSPISLTDRQQLILEHLGVDPIHVDALIERTSLGEADILQELTLLSLKGVVRRSYGTIVRSDQGSVVNIRHDHVTVFVARQVETTYELLQLRRSTGDFLGGTWQIVRGAAENNETSMQAALRQLREETGLLPLEFYSLGVVESFYIASTDMLYHSPAFLAVVSIDTPITLNNEHDAFRWIAIADADRLCMWPSEKPLLAHSVTQILTNGPSKPFLQLRP